MVKYLALLGFCLIAFTSLGQQPKDTTIYLKSGVIRIERCDSVTMPDYFEHQRQIDSIANQYDNSEERYRAIETFQIKKFNPPIKIQGRERIVRLQDGTDIILVPDTANDLERTYAFVKEFRQYDFFLFRVQWFEGNNFFLLNTKTGEKTYTIGQVYFNHVGNFLLSINDDIEAGYSGNGFQLFTIGKGRTLSEIWKYDPSWAPEQIKWVNDNTFIVRGYTFATGYKMIFFYKKITITLK